MQGSVITWRISTLSAHKGCPGPEQKYDTKNENQRWNNREDQAHVTGTSCSWTMFPEPGRIFLPAFCFPALMKLSTPVPPILPDIPFPLLQHTGEKIKLKKSQEGGSSCLIGQKYIFLHLSCLQRNTVDQHYQKALHR